MGFVNGPWSAARYAGSFEPFPYTTRDTTPLGRYVIERATLATPQGPSPYSIVHCKPCACVFIVVGRNVLFVRQYRYAVGSWQDELVAGGIEQGETPVAAALREMREETGFWVAEGGMTGAADVVSLGAFFPSGGSSDEIMYLFGVRLPGDAVPQATRFDRGERTERLLLSREEVERRMAEGSLTHSALYVAWERLRLRGLLDVWLPAA